MLRLPNRFSNAVGLDSAAELAEYAKKRDRNSGCCSMLRHKKVASAALFLLAFPFFFIFRFDKVMEEEGQTQIWPHTQHENSKGGTQRPQGGHKKNS